MCVMSMVHDDFSKRIPTDWSPTFPLYPGAGTTITTGALMLPATSAQVESLRQEVAALKQLVLDFHEAVKAAAIVDRLTRQPDCVDPEKARLEERVRELEGRLDAVRAALGTP